MPETALYEKDFYAWASETAEAIRSGEFARIDAIALADEVAPLGRQERRTVRARLETLISFLLQRRSPHVIATQRQRVMKLLKESPSLTPWLSENMTEIYQIAVQLAVRDTNRSHDRFPPTCPYTLDEVLSTTP
jgi:hypothetical protein